MRSLQMLALLLLPAIAAAADIKTELIQAARRLGEKTNYSWTQTRLIEITNLQSKVVPLEGKFSAPNTIYLRQDRIVPVRQVLSDAARYTNELAIVGSRCAIKSQWFRGDVDSASKDWEGYSSPRPPLYSGYYLTLASVPHIEVQQFIAAAEDVKFDAGTFLLTFAPDRLLHLRTNRPVARVLGAEGWMRLWISNALPIQYETRILETNVIKGGFWAPREWLTNSATNHSLIRIHNVGTTKIQIPQEAIRAMANPTNATDRSF